MNRQELYCNMGKPLGEVLRKPMVPPKPSSEGPPRVPSRQQSASSNSPGEPELPLYASLLPKPFMSGYMEKASGENVGKNLLWSKKYVEVSKGTLTFYDSIEKRDSEHEVVLPLSDVFISWHDKRTLALKNSSGVRLFRTSSELRANKWFYVLSSYCSVPPIAEGYCKKLSGRKSILEDRYVKLSIDGIISWYKGEDDTEPKGSLMVRGEQISVDQDDSRVVFIHTPDRRFHFQFLDEEDAKMWRTVLQWHINRTPQVHTRVVVRNPTKLKLTEE